MISARELQALSKAIVKDIMYRRKDINPCLCGAVRDDTQDNDIWVGSSWNNDSKYPNSLPEKFFIMCDECERITEYADSESQAIEFWNNRKFKLKF